MASEGNSSIVAIVAIVIIVLLGGFVAWRMGVFGGAGAGDSGGDRTHKIDVDLE
jgi:hypothetical protein